jgi:hypothetical protein
LRRGRGQPEHLGGFGELAAQVEHDDFVQTLSELYGTMVAQDSVAGIERYVDCTSHGILQKMRQVENDYSRLQLREERLLSLSKQMGLITNETRIEALQPRGDLVEGMHDDDDDDDDDEPHPNNNEEGEDDDEGS